ncbi:murein biosynthesis integral membrane protein MurJ [Diaminobutyricimonas sp. TR449]|uniref:murein biosynthesis integral membrane protein MurJ n=1 Tax=Diaminobutyricimonas sp. TR449 TaxID=2708076 RepID=UPI00141F759E|nr:murein biosynthesis integral membrane protein MurJ [Diaminobutyricimonas sp. TR449]
MSDVDEPSGVRRASALLASGSMVSRVLGFVSAFLLAATIGSFGSGANMFAIANGLPNSIYAIIAGGVLSAVLVPQIVRAGLNADGGEAYINKLLTLGIVIFAIAAIVATLCAPLLVQLYSQSATGDTGGISQEQFALATAFAYWCLPQVFFYALYSLLGEVLNARSVFGPFTWAPALNNVVAIAGIVAFALLYGAGQQLHEDAATWTPDRVALLAGSATLGIAAQALILFAFWRRAGLRFRPDFHWRGVGLRRTGKSAAWIFGMIVATQIAGIVQTNVASLAAADNDAASVAVLRYAWLIFMLPHGIITVSIATAYFTRMNKHARDADLGSLRTDVAATLRTTGLLLVFSSIGLMAIAAPFGRIFAHNFAEAQSIAGVLTAYLVGLLPFSILFVLQRVFYSLEDTRTPFWCTLVQSVLNVIGFVLVQELLPLDQLAIGIAAVVTVSGTVQVILIGLLLGRRIPGMPVWQLLRDHLLFFAAMIPAAAAGVGVVTLLGGFSPSGFAMSGVLPAFVTIAAAGSVMAVIYGGILLLFRNPHARDFLAPVLRRLR